MTTEYLKCRDCNVEVHMYISTITMTVIVFHCTSFVNYNYRRLSIVLQMYLSMYVNLSLHKETTVKSMKVTEHLLQ